jgi:hemerythrin-like metal-binding protein
MEWSDKFSVGIGQIDNEHRRLLALLNELNNVVEGSAGPGVLGGVLDGLVDYTHYHFAHEEDLFQRSNYPGYEQHRQQHVDFVAKVTAVYGDFKSGSSAVQPAKVLEFLKSWLYHHILGSDRAFGAYLLANPSSLRPQIRRR